MPVPDDLVEWADDATFDDGPDLGDNTKVQPPVGVAEQGFVPGFTFGSQHVNYTINNIVQWLHWFRGTGGDGTGGWFGDASDGNVTIGAGTTTLTRDMFYGDLDIEAGGILETAGFRIFVRGTLGNEGTITAAGADGSAGVSGDGGTGGVGYSDGTIAGSIAGGAGGDPGVGGVAGSSVANSLGGIGADGDDSSGLGGSGGDVVLADGPPRHATQLILGQAMPGSAIAEGGSGGGGGGGGGGAASGGGGGAGGGAIVIVAWNIVNNGSITTNGGVGGDSFGAAAGGGGGGGGWIGIATHLGISGAGTITADGGVGGNGFGGLAGSGTDGTIIQLII